MRDAGWWVGGGGFVGCTSLPLAHDIITVINIILVKLLLLFSFLPDILVFWPIFLLLLLALLLLLLLCLLCFWFLSAYLLCRCILLFLSRLSLLTFDFAIRCEYNLKHPRNYLLEQKMNEWESEQRAQRGERGEQGRKEVLMGERLKALLILIALEGRTGMAGRILS